MKYKIKGHIYQRFEKVISAKDHDDAEHSADDLSATDLKPKEIIATDFNVDSVEPVPSTKKIKP